MGAAFSIRRVASVARKEVLHIARDPATVFFALAIPLVEMFLLGYAIDTNVRRIPTAYCDLCHTQESRELLRAFETSDDFNFLHRAGSEDDLHRLIISGKARVGILIPEDYSRQVLSGDNAEVLILVDGSESSVAAEALNVGNALALRESLEKLLPDGSFPVESRPRILFNPDTRSANFFIPGLLVVLSQMMATMLTANAIVREKENGTLEQLFMTPVRPGELMVGKLIPYLGLTLLEFCGILTVMRFGFQVPIHGNVVTLLLVALPFIITCLGLGLWISTRATTREAASQMVIGSVLPSIFLSGYVFPIQSMPWPFHHLAYAIPTTWLIDASRGVILRGAGWSVLWQHLIVLGCMGSVIILIASLQFRKTLS